MNRKLDFQQFDKDNIHASIFDNCIVEDTVDFADCGTVDLSSLSSNHKSLTHAIDYDATSIASSTGITQSLDVEDGEDVIVVGEVNGGDNGYEFEEITGDMGGEVGGDTGRENGGERRGERRGEKIGEKDNEDLSSDYFNDYIQYNPGEEITLPIFAQDGGVTNRGSGGDDSSYGSRANGGVGNGGDGSGGDGSGDGCYCSSNGSSSCRCSNGGSSGSSSCRCSCRLAPNHTTIHTPLQALPQQATPLQTPPLSPWSVSGQRSSLDWRYHPADDFITSPQTHWSAEDISRYMWTKDQCSGSPLSVNDHEDSCSISTSCDSQSNKNRL